MRILRHIENIDRQQWERLVNESSTATWFQTFEAYRFYVSLPEVLTPFVVAIKRSQESRAKSQESLQGVIVGYVTKEQSAVKQFFTRRAIVMGGPLLSEEITDAELTALLRALSQDKGQRTRDKGRRTKDGLLHTPIYIEMRNFNDYSRWKNVFEQCGFAYQKHLNFHINTTSVERIDKHLNRNRKRNIRAVQQRGAAIVEKPTLEQVRAFYVLLQSLYTNKIRLPLFPLAFFEQLWKLDSSLFLLVERGGEIVGGTAHVMLSNKALYAWYGCGEETEQASDSPTSFVTYAGMCYAAEHGLPRFDMMGAGRPNEAYGVRNFKAQFGGELVEHGRFLQIVHPLLYKIGKLGVWLMQRCPKG